MNLNKLKYLRNDDVMGGAKCTARTGRRRTPLPYTTVKGPPLDRSHAQARLLINFRLR